MAGAEAGRTGRDAAPGREARNGRDRRERPASQRPRKPRPGNLGAWPEQVTVIGHNTQTVAVVGLFVGADVPVRVFTASPAIEESLAPYPGVTVTQVTDDYRDAPRDLPPPPYFLTVDAPAEAEHIKAWLPPTRAKFLERSEHRGSLPIPGFLRLEGTQPEDRAGIRRRLASLADLDRLCALVRGAEKPLILLHGDPDPDAIGAALGLAALWKAAGVACAIRYTGEVHRYQNKLLIHWLRRRRPITRLESAEAEASDLIAVVDAQPGFWRTDPPTARVVIDHHPRRPDTQAEWLDLREDYGSTSTIVTEYLLDAGVAIDRQLATALLYGITTDTNDLKRHTLGADIAAFEALHHRADRRFLERLEKSQIPPALLDWIGWGISHRVVHRDLVVVHFGVVPTPDVLVQVADLLLLTYGVAWVVCAGIVEAGRADGRKLVVVFRGDGVGVDVGKRASAAFARLGSAGGHRTMGRAEVPLDDRDIPATADLLVDHLFTRMSSARKGRLADRLKAHLADQRPADPDDYELGA